MEEEQKEKIAENIQSPEKPNPTVPIEMKKVSRLRRAKKFPKFNKKIIFIVILVVILVSGGWYILQEPEFEDKDTIQETLTTPPSPTPVPTQRETEKEVVEVDKEQVTIEILNGTGIAREATFLQGKLRSLGYLEIEIGNTSRQDREVTTFNYSSSLAKGVVDEITDELENVYKEVDSRSSNNLDYNVEIITGLRKGQSFPTATIKPTVAPASSETPTPTVTGTTTPTPSPSATPTP